MFEPSPQDRSPEREDLNFFEELDRLATSSDGPAFSIVLLSGDRYRVDRPDQLAVFRTMYVYYAASGMSVMFPFPSVCAIEIDDHLPSTS